MRRIDVTVWVVFAGAQLHPSGVVGKNILEAIPPLVVGGLGNVALQVRRSLGDLLKLYQHLALRDLALQDLALEANSA